MNIVKKIFFFLLIYIIVFIILLSLAQVMFPPFIQSAFLRKFLSIISWLTPMFTTYSDENIAGSTGFNVYFLLINIVYTLAIYQLVIVIIKKVRHR